MKTKLKALLDQFRNGERGPIEYHELANLLVSEGDGALCGTPDALHPGYVTFNPTVERVAVFEGKHYSEEEYREIATEAVKLAEKMSFNDNDNEWLVANLMKTLRPLRDFAQDYQNPYLAITTLEWEAFTDAANRMVRDYTPSSIDHIHRNREPAAQGDAKNALANAKNALANAQDTKDAERYRWLRAIGKDQQHVISFYAMGEMDKRIDAAIAAKAAS